MKLNEETEKLLAELIQSQTDLEEKTKDQGHKIKVLQAHLKKAEIAAAALNVLIWPIAMFVKNGRITMANPKFCTLTGLTPEDIASGTYKIADYLNFENAGMKEALRDVFKSTPADLQDQNNPLRIKPGAGGDTPPVYTRTIFYTGVVDENGVEYSAVFFLER